MHPYSSLAETAIGTNIVKKYKNKSNYIGDICLLANKDDHILIAKKKS